jgi:hypothetical protein
MTVSTSARDKDRPAAYDLPTMEELAWARHLVDRAIERLEDEMPDSPLLDLELLELRRILAEAAFRELRAIQREIRREAKR